MTDETPKGDTYVFTQSRPRDVASGRMLAPGATIDAAGLDLDDPNSHDSRLVAEGALKLQGSGPKPDKPVKPDNGGNA